MPSDINGIPYALPADKLASWSATSKNLAQWIDTNVIYAPAMTYDSGERNVTGLLSDVTEGNMYVRRVGRQVWIDVQEMRVANPSVSFSKWNAVLPHGFRPLRTYIDLSLSPRANSDSIGSMRVSKYGEIVIYSPTGTLYGLVSFLTGTELPAALPGTPA